MDLALWLACAYLSTTSLLETRRRRRLLREIAKLRDVAEIHRDRLAVAQRMATLRYAADDEQRRVVADLVARVELLAPTIDEGVRTAQDALRGMASRLADLETRLGAIERHRAALN